MQTKRRVVETNTPCPRCDGKLHMRQVGLVLDQAPDVLWRDDERFCPRGCLYTADEVVQQ